MPITIKHKSNHKSIIDMDSIELPDFVILTGLNGSGKSQLLEAIAQQNGGAQVFNGDTEITNVRHVTHATLVPNNTGAIDHSQLRSASNSIVGIYAQYKNYLAQNPGVRIDQALNAAQYAKQIKVIMRIAEDANKPIDNLSEDDIYKYYPIDDGLIVNDVFQHNFSMLFKRYHTKYIDNEFDEFLNSKHGHYDFLTKEKFENIYGPPPWELVNRVLEESQVDYILNDPHGSHRDTPFTLQLENKITGAKINFNDLSSGEKVLVSIALSLYNLNVQVDFPEILLMDEPDAPLHPSMTKHFIDVVKKVFVEEKGVKVIMTTHSPSTIALAPDESIYVMNKTNPRLVNMSKDSALNLLTSGVPSLSVDYENRRQVFVESKYDQNILEGVYLKLLPMLCESDISLNFICPGIDGSAGCDSVKNIVGKLTEYGNPYVYGIIDWDCEHKSTSNIKVLGEECRYSIENYLFDPLLLAVYLIREKITERDHFGITEAESYLDIRSFNAVRLQSLSDKVISDLLVLFDTHEPAGTTSCKLINGLTLSIPNWYLQVNGHELEEAIKETYKPLKRFTNEGSFKKDVLKKIVDDIPEFLSEDFSILYNSLRV